MEPTKTAIDLVKEAHAALEAHDRDRFLALMAQDGTYSDSTCYLYKPEFKGAEEVADLLFAIYRAYPDGHTEFKDIFAAGDTVVLEGVFTGTHAAQMVFPGMALPPDVIPPPTGKKVTFPVLQVFTVRNGKIARGASYYDGVTIMMEEGLVPQPAPALT